MILGILAAVVLLGSIVWAVPVSAEDVFYEIRVQASNDQGTVESHVFEHATVQKFQPILLEGGIPASKLIDGADDVSVKLKVYR